MSARDVADGCVAFAPLEPPGTIVDYFKAIRLCDAGTRLTNETWNPLLGAQRFIPETLVSTHFPDGNYRDAMARYAERILKDARAPEAGFAALSAQIIGTPDPEIPGFMTSEIAKVFAAHPDGSLWLIRTNELFSRRFTLLRMLATNQLAPDYFDQHVAGEEADVRGMRDQSLTRGADPGKLVHPLLLMFSPATLGVTLPWLPHTLVFLTGHTSSLIRQYPATPWALYDPGIQGNYEGGGRYGDFVVNVPTGTIEALVQWWVRRLNVAYTHLLDPTAFSDDLGWHQPRRQLGQFLTFERLLADHTLIQMLFAGPELSRQQSAFDLLDKAESLLGIDASHTGQGFEQMLHRTPMLERLNRAWRRTPFQLQARLAAWTTRLYEELYEDVLGDIYPHRLRPNGVRVHSEAINRLTDMETETFVAKLIRAQRNSAHGFVHVLTSSQRQAKTDRAVLGGHTGRIPPAFADLAALIAFALVADFERVADQTWLTE